MAGQLRPGDRVRLVTEPTYRGDWGVQFVGPLEGVGGWGVVSFIESDTVAHVSWDSPGRSNGTPGDVNSYGIDIECIALDLPASLDREGVEAWLESP